MLKIALQPACLLHSKPYKDTSALVEVITPEYGRLGLIAKGARGRARQYGMLQPFRHLLISWSGRGDLPVLTHVEEAAPAVALRGRTLVSALYVNELLVRLLHRNDPHPRLFERYCATLQELARADKALSSESLEVSLRIFEKHLLEELGYGLQLEYEAGEGAAIHADIRYEYRVEIGPIALPAGAPGSASDLVVRGASLLALAREKFHDAQSLQDNKRLLRAVLRHYLGERPLRSRELLI